METLLRILISISLLFFVILAVREFFKEKTKEKICSICFAVSLTWIVLLMLVWAGKFNNKTILALLMGMSVLGVFYLSEKKFEKKFLVFRLPFLLTMVLIAYSLIEGIENIFEPVIFLSVLWAIFALFYFFKNIKTINFFVNKIIECCKKW